MKKQITFVLVGIVILGIFAFVYGTKPAIPKVGAEGKINGNYTIEGIMRLGKPYVCTFEKSDGSSTLSGLVHTDGQKIYEEFKIKTDLVKNGFSSFLLIKDDVTYTWTSLQKIGYKSAIVKSASQNASPQEQAQIVGTRDAELYQCKPWLNVNSSIFETPTSITFSELKK